MTNVADTTNPIPMQSPPNGSYGAEIQPKGPLQDMYASIQLIAGSVHDRTDTQTAFTGGMGTLGIGGVALPPSPIADPLGGPIQDVP